MHWCIDHYCKLKFLFVGLACVVCFVDSILSILWKCVEQLRMYNFSSLNRIGISDIREADDAWRISRWSRNRRPIVIVRRHLSASCFDALNSVLFRRNALQFSKIGTPEHKKTNLHYWFVHRFSMWYVVIKQFYVS